MNDRPPHRDRGPTVAIEGAGDPAASHIEVLRADVRGEIKQRIEQRDRYSVQLTLSMGAIVAFAFSKDGFRMALVAAPLVSIYFTVLILYSYRIHTVLAHYMRDQIEPAIAKAAGTDLNMELETWYGSRAVPGIRRSFFVATLWAITGLTMAYLLLAERSNHFDELVLWCLTAVYVTAAIAITYAFGGKTHKRMASNRR